jgi:hypothetical protein
MAEALRLILTQEGGRIPDHRLPGLSWERRQLETAECLVGCREHADESLGRPGKAQTDSGGHLNGEMARSRTKRQRTGHDR